MLTLKSTGVVAEVCRGLVAGHSTFSHPANSRSVVGPVGDGGVPYVEVACHQGGLSEDASLLQVTIRDRALGVVIGDQVSLDVLGERKAPQVGFSLAIVEDSPHASLGCVGSAQQCGLLGDDLS